MKKNVAANLAAGAVIVFANLLLVPLSIELAGPKIYGAWAVCFGTIVLLGQADLGLGGGLVRQLAFSRQLKQLGEANRVNLAGLLFFSALAILMSLVTVSVLPLYFQVAQDQIERELLIKLVVAAAISVGFAMLGRYFIAVTQSYAKYGIERLAAVLAQLVRVSIMLTALASGLSYDLMLVADSVSFVLVPVFLFGYMKTTKKLPRACGINRELWDSVKSLVSFSIPMFVSSFATLATMQAPLYIVGGLVGFKDASGFAAVMRIYQSSRTVLGWISGPALPVASEAAARNDRRQLAGLHLQITIVSSCLAIIMIVPFAIHAGGLLTFWLGEGFASYGSCLFLIGVAIFVNSMYAPGVIVATGAGRPGVVAWNNVIQLLLTVVLSFVGTNLFGVVGGAAATALGSALVFPFSQWRTVRVTGMRTAVPYLIVLLSLSVAAVSLWTVSSVSPHGLFGVIWDYAFTATAVASATWFASRAASRRTR